MGSLTSPSCPTYTRYHLPSDQTTAPAHASFATSESFEPLALFAAGSRAHLEVNPARQAYGGQYWIFRRAASSHPREGQILERRNRIDSYRTRETHHQGANRFAN